MEHNVSQEQREAAAETVGLPMYVSWAKASEWVFKLLNKVMCLNLICQMKLDLRSEGKH